MHLNPSYEPDALLGAERQMNHIVPVLKESLKSFWMNLKLLFKIQLKKQKKAWSLFG